MSREIKFESVEKSVAKTLDIDSTFRDRNKYPYSSDFVVPFTNLGRRGNLFNSFDPVALSAPYEYGITSVSGTNISVVIPTGMIGIPHATSSLDNFYIGDILGLGISGTNYYRTVIGYTGLTNTLIVSTPFPANTDDLLYTLRKGTPMYEGTLQAGTTSSTLVLDSGSTPSNYVGNFVRITSGIDYNMTKVIQSYTGSAINISPNFIIAPSPGDTYEILQFSYDNLNPLIYSGSDFTSQPVCYRLRLTSISVPFTELANGYGGAIDSYPYLYVDLYSENSRNSSQTLYSNNPASRDAVFKVSVDVPLFSPESRFVTLYCSQTETIKFKPNDSMHFRVRLPSGEIIMFIHPEEYSPLAPNPLVQINATFEMVRIL